MAKEKDYGEATFGRKLAAASFPGIHGAIAARRGQKLNVAARQYGSGFVGALPGGVVTGAGILAKNPILIGSGQLISSAGAAGMSIHSTNKSQRRGQLKPQRVSKSYDFTDAFGVERPDIIAKSWTMNYKAAESGANGTARAFRDIKNKAGNPKMNNSQQKKVANQIKAIKDRRNFA